MAEQLKLWLVEHQKKRVPASHPMFKIVAAATEHEARLKALGDGKRFSTGDIHELTAATAGVMFDLG